MTSKISSATKSIYDQITSDSTKRGDLKKLAKEIKVDHEMAMELWSTGELMPQMMAALIMDKKLLSQDVLDRLDKDLQHHNERDQNHIMEWLMANQLMKDKNTIELILSWQNSKSVLQRRTFWYYKARLRWTGQTPPEDTADLLSYIERNIANEAPQVQWTMNFLAAWIGIFDKQYRDRCIAIGEKHGLYKDEKVVKNCTPNYLPEFIRIETEKRNL